MMELRTLLAPAAVLALCLALTVDAQLAAAVNKTNNGVRGRDGKLLSLFQVVRFPNDPCGGNGNRNGTCYTEQECDNRGGTSQGSCAQGYGVCCVFALNCGQSSSENCTYFESTGGEIGACQLEVCKCDSNICQLRLDFNTFSISGPSTSTVVSGKNVGGNDITTSSQCLTDTFAVTSPGTQTPPTICGLNSGEHMYVDASEACNDLTFQLGNAGIGTGLNANRQWNIKVTQYACDFDNLAPQGCTQYFFGSNAGVVNTYNNQGGEHLAAQNQNICVRQERGQCRICWFTVDDDDFAVSGMTASTGFATASTCCGYGTAGAGTKGWDCVVIPGAILTTTADSLLQQEAICGRRLIAATAASAGPKTVCSDRVPFQIRFMSDEYEMAAEAAFADGTDSGFKLSYVMSTDCNTRD